MADTPDPTEEELLQTLLERASHHYITESEWPELLALQRNYHREGGTGSLRNVAYRTNLMAGLGRVDGMTHRVVLTVKGLSRCPEAAPLLEDFVRIVKFAVGRYFSAGDDPLVITRPDLVTMPEGDLGELDLAARLLEGENCVAATWPNDWPNGSVGISDDVHHFKGIQTVENYLEARDAWSAPMQPSMPITWEEPSAAFSMQPAAGYAPPPPTPTDTSEGYVSQLADEEGLARDIMRRLETAEPLSQVLPAARHLARLTGKLDVAQWLEWESAGYSPATPSLVRQQAHGLWEPLHLVQDPVKAAAAMMQNDDPALPPRDVPMVLITAPMSVLESAEKPVDLDPGLRPDAYQNRLAGLVNSHQRLVLIARVRQAVHSFASDLLQGLVGQRNRITFFGPDAVTVFAAGGSLLQRLGAAGDDLGRPGRESSACIEARSALEQMGLELYQGDGQPYASPIDGKQYNPTTSETHRLHALIDDLWSRTDDDRRRSALAAAHASAQLVRKTGGRAKTQPIRYEEARQVVQAAFRVAHAICFEGGFPPADHSPY